MIQLFFKLLSILPLWCLHAFGGLLGLMYFFISARYRSEYYNHLSVYLGKNLRPPLSFRLISSAHAGMAMLELPYYWRRNMRLEIGKTVRIENWHHIEKAQQQGQGILFLTPHLGCFEATAQIFASREPITILYRPHRKKQFQEIIQSYRAQNNISLAPTNLKGVRQLLKALKQNKAVGLLPDQVPAKGEGVWVPMFGQPAYTMTLVGALAKSTHCQIILAVGVRRPFSGVTLKLYEGPKNLPNDPSQAATIVNQSMEELIRAFPEQYIWGYNRYKQPKPRDSVAENL